MKNITEIIFKMTLEDKIKLCSGESFWATEKMEEYGIPSFFLSDGPHGLRTQKGEADHLGINQSEKSTCFPTASASTSTWNPELLKKMGEAIAEEALANEVDVVLGPGVCMKRNPLCGRNFEYFSEDPYLAGRMGTSWIQGVQSKGIGTSLKHYAANNQEQDRMMGDSMVDERAFREIYLPAFEMAVKESQPDTVMCSYNKINGTFASDNKKLLTDILREEWGFEGLVVTDWGAMNDRVKAFKAGCDLEMPSSAGFFDEAIQHAVEDGSLLERDIDICVERIIRLALKAEKTRNEYHLTKDYRGNGTPDDPREVTGFDIEGHHGLARKIAEESAVLLKNEENILPLKKGTKIALCGAMAETIRYQGAGSSHINPTKLPSMREAMSEAESVSYYSAYQMNGERDASALKEAIEGAKSAEAAIVVVGLPDSFESEGYDRAHMQMPESHNELIHEIAKVNQNVIVVLMGGSPVEMPWLGEVKAVLNMYLGGQGAGEAATNLLYGEANPSGKLAETYPVKYEDCSSAETFGINPRQVEYAESIYVGYRYYEKAGMKVQFPFGHGLSYTTFEISGLNITGLDEKQQLDMAKKSATVNISCKVKNTGEVAGAEVVQIYVADQTPDVFKAKKELKGFVKVYLEAGEEKEVQITLNQRAFAHYDVKSCDWEVLSGTYEIQAGNSSQHASERVCVEVKGTTTKMPYETLPSWYIKPEGKPAVSDFEKIYGSEIKSFEMEKPGEYTLLNTFNDMMDNPIVAQIANGMKDGIVQQYGGDETNAEYIFTVSIIMNTPLVRLVQQGGGMTPIALMEATVGAANGSPEAMAALGEIMEQMG